ncbi:hypothetical protein [Ekhidna sp.]
MKKILPILSIFALILISSCGSDDTSTSEPKLSGTVTFDGQSYTVANGFFTQGETDGAAEGIFFISDGTFTVGSSGNVTASDATIIITIRAIHEGASVIGGGAYITNSITQDQYAFVTVQTASDESQSFVGGTVNISGSGNSYDVTFTDVPFGQGVTLTGTVTGTYSN